MKYGNQEELDAIATEFIRLKTKASTSKSKAVKRKFENYQNYCVEQFRWLITNRVSKYRQFANYEDLEQDGFEALILALKTYNPKKGSFTWWADKYISTRVARSANTHSTIRIPLKKAKTIKPFKVNEMPISVDSRPDALQSIHEYEEKISVTEAIAELPKDQREVISSIYGFHGKPNSIGNTTKVLDISRPECVRLLNEAKFKLKEILAEE